MAFHFGIGSLQLHVFFYLRIMALTVVQQGPQSLKNVFITITNLIDLNNYVNE